MPQSVEATVRKLIEPIIFANDLELVDIEWKTKNGSMNLCIYIDKDGGINLNDCEAVHYEISDLLDKLDPIPHSYLLEVSSPGIERSLTKREDYHRFADNPVRITLNAPLENQKKYKGILRGLAGDHVVLEIKDPQKTISIPLTMLEKANICYEPVPPTGKGVRRKK